MEGFNKKVSRLVAIHVMGCNPKTSPLLVASLGYADDCDGAYSILERIAELGLIDEYCRAMNPCRNRIFVKEPMPNCSPANVIDWVMIKATPLHRSLAALETVGYDIRPLLDEAGWPELPLEDK